MSSPLTDATHATPSSAFNSLTSRQRAERVLDTLPVAGGVLSETASGRDNTGRGELIEPVQRINEVMRPYGLQFELSEFEKRVVTRIVDRDSGEVIRQIPAEEVLAVAERLAEVQGRLVNLEA
ncbi:flagellar protein FlaG [Halomonas urumqiensis]|uniref:Flagellar protein n=1 Tax=Halomonas urumqiensis TaxID=1684789 RepID=A0A2N7UNR3_9GAMM|nr:flagellar protein FlaG [Halomonas urumqiensis]PMR82090.1 flagellar protein [Halomonas urumqiensis]PTB02579.1 flagellar protein [Halomonas urumqiensis]GHE21059.1 flagellar protein FlaG [Halomonas urumqiensis]